MGLMLSGVWPNFECLNEKLHVKNSDFLSKIEPVSDMEIILTEDVYTNISIVHTLERIVFLWNLRLVQLGLLYRVTTLPNYLNSGVVKIVFKRFKSESEVPALCKPLFLA